MDKQLLIIIIAPLIVGAIWYYQDYKRKQTIVLARLNEVLDMQLYLTKKKVKLDEELKQLEQVEKEESESK